MIAESSPFKMGDPRDTDAMKVARFQAKEKAHFIPEWELRTGDRFQVWHCRINGILEPFMQNFDYPIESIQLIRSDEKIQRRYQALFQAMNNVYEALYFIRSPFYVLRPSEIVAGRCVIAQVFPLSRQMQHEFPGLMYQRVQILETFGVKKSHLIKCYCVDLGTVMNVDFRLLFHMLDDFARPPRQVIQITFEELAEWKMDTQFRYLFLNGLYLHNSTITLDIKCTKDASGQLVGDVRMESSRFPGRDFVHVIKDCMKKLMREPTRSRYRKDESNSMRNRLLAFTSLTPIALEGVNFGTPGEPVVYPQVGNMLDFVVVGYDPGTAGLMHIIPYLSDRAWPLAKFDISQYYENYWLKNTGRCHCLKDGSYFCVRTRHGFERGRLLERKYLRAFTNPPSNQKPVRTVPIVFLDRGHVQSVKACHVHYLPPEYALLAPAQVIVAYWTRTDGAGKSFFFEWNDREWDAFGRFAANNRIRFFGKVLKVSRDLIGRVLVNIELYNPKTHEVMDPMSNFWIKDEPRKRYFVQ